MNDYSDIINIKYTGPKNHPRMTRENRAAQFASFRALSGYEDELKETRRKVDTKIILNNDKKEILDNKLKEIEFKLKDNPKITITYFVKDLKKEGGFYKTINSYIKKIDFQEKQLILLNKEKIAINNIIDLNIMEEEI